MHLYILDHDPSVRTRIRQILSSLAEVEAVTDIAAAGDIQTTKIKGNIPVMVASAAALGRGDIQKLLRLDPHLAVIVVGGNDTERMRAAFSEGARAFVRKSELTEELPSALEILAGGGIYLPPVIGMRAGGEPLMTTAGPVPAGFFREDGAQQLTPRQREILSMIRDGYNNTEIAEALDLTVGTVKIHITAIFKALGVRNRTQATIAAEWLDLPKHGKAQG
ncbi:response regulator transcription factor [Oleisolibacter albus]|uniref:response regulator transcription factor n=1 Tax=Oleisolibacter albus TaxID=2171757 RepID=UPI001EFC9785|nr:response regulator transcription factor [Oleisolibacter albus]